MKLVGDDMKKDGRQYFFRKQVMIFWMLWRQARLAGPKGIRQVYEHQVHKQRNGNRQECTLVTSLIQQPQGRVREPGCSHTLPK